MAQVLALISRLVFERLRLELALEDRDTSKHAAFDQLGPAMSDGSAARCRR